MPISIKNSETENLARRLAELTGESLTDAVRGALAERYERLKRARAGHSLSDELNEIAMRCARRPDISTLSADEILGYDDAGVPEPVTLDTSAVLAVLLDEPERGLFLSKIEQAERRLISAASVLEAAMVLEGRKGNDAGVDLDIFLQRASVEIIPFDKEQLLVARSAFRRFGKGWHVAGLNFGDCAAYALAQWSGEPLLFKGADFAATDVVKVR